MRILVVSDTHRDSYSLRQAILQQPTAEVILHLGDGEEEIMDMKLEFPKRMIIPVRGNCDWGSTLPSSEEICLEGKRIFMTHGHLYQVKMGYHPIYCAAREKKADILLFGHTHVPMQDYDDGLYVLNPGSLNGANASYGILDITPAGIMTNLLTLR